MSLWKYKYFLDVVELKSFTKAGARNYVTQTAVSQQIASLEKMAGGTLLERGNGEICLTELGEIVYEYAREMVQTYERMLHEIERYKESSVVRIGIDSSINKLFWAKMQKMINDKHSEAELSQHSHGRKPEWFCLVTPDLLFFPSRNPGYASGYQQYSHRFPASQKPAAY